MKIKDMTKEQLIERIANATAKLENPVWVKKQSKHWIGVIFVNRSKLEAELKRRNNES